MNLWKAYALALKRYHEVSMKGIEDAVQRKRTVSEITSIVKECEKNVFATKQALLAAG